MADFADWLSGELRERGWSNNELARRAEVSSAAVSYVLTRQHKPGAEFCLKVSEALNEAPTKVFRLAGLLPSHPESDGGLEEVVFYFSRMTPKAQDMYRVLGKSLVEASRKGEL